MERPPESTIKSLALKCAASTPPTLSEDDLLVLLDEAAIVDSAGRPPSDFNWRPTYDLVRAAAAGWEVKAGRCSDNYGFTSDRETFNREQVFEHCMGQAEVWRRKIVSAVKFGGAS